MDMKKSSFGVLVYIDRSNKDMPLSHNCLFWLVSLNRIGCFSFDLALSLVSKQPILIDKIIEKWKSAGDSTWWPVSSNVGKSERDEVKYGGSLIKCVCKSGCVCVCEWTCSCSWVCVCACAWVRETVYQNLVFVFVHSITFDRMSLTKLLSD